MREFDVVVAGGGSAGCVVAARLSENPDCSVSLVEAGPDYGPHDDGGWPADILNGCELAFSHAWERSDPDDRSQLRAKILGGCSSHNACALLPGSSSDYDEWGHGWTAGELQPFVDRAADAMRRRRFAPEELSPLSRAVLDAAPELRLPRLEDATEDGAGAGPFPVNAVGSTRWNAAFAYLDPARSRSNLTIHPNALVDRVRLDGDRATGIVLEDGAEIAARTVVLTASAYGSPAILLRSGIGPERGLPVGENLIDHSGIGVGWAASEALRGRRRPVRQALAALHGAGRGQGLQRRLHRGHVDLHLFPATDPARTSSETQPEAYELSAAAFAMKPRSRGRIRLAEPDPRLPPVVEHGFLSDPADLEVLVDGLALVRRLGASEPMNRYATGEVRPGFDADPEAYIRENVRGYFHPVGTCALGAVVDAGGAVIGHEDLYVADASVMPTIPRANTNLSTLAVAEKIAAVLAAG